MGQKNILLIFTDQQRYDTIEALGNRIIRTPALNSLVANGITFTRAYTPCPVCIPARYALHTGLMPHQADCVINETTSAEHQSFMDILQANGYQTHGVGKMHFSRRGLPAETLWGFESRDVSEEGGGPDAFKQHLDSNGYQHVHDPQGVRSEMYYIPQPSQLPARLHNTTWVVDRSIDFLERRDRDRPFFLMTSFIKPHPPFESPTPWNKLYRGPEMPLPKRPQDSENLMTFWNKFQNRYKYRDQGVDDNLIRQIKAAYYSAISFVDYNVGRLLNYMQANGLTGETLIIFTSDHGEMLGDYNCVGKRNFLDSAARIPLLMVHPDLAKGQVCSKPVNLVDVFPTLLQYAGIEPPSAGNGQSLADIAAGKTPRDITFGQYHRQAYGQYMAVTEQYKYIYSAADQKEWLFDLLADPEETRNRAGNPLYFGPKEILRGRLMASLVNDGYSSPFSGGHWRKGEIQVLPADPDAFLLLQDPPASIPNIPGYERQPQQTAGQDEPFMPDEPFFPVGF